MDSSRTTDGLCPQALACSLVGGVSRAVNDMIVAYCTQAQKNNWQVGDKTDETIHMELMAGPVTAAQPFTLEKDSPGSALLRSARRRA